MPSVESADVVVIGAGIVGLATAHSIVTARPGTKVVVVDKEGSIAGHQTGRNSGVIHAGVYYKPGSDKARLCALGRQRMVEFCTEHGVAHEVCGKVVVAVSADEQPASGRAAPAVRGQRRGRRADRAASGWPSSSPTPPASRRCTSRSPGSPTTPACAACSPSGSSSTAASCGWPPRSPGWPSRPDGIVIETTAGPVRARQAVNCAGLQADRIARLFGGDGGGPGDDDRAVPRRVLRARPVAQPPRAIADLPGARSAVPVPRGAPHARGQRPGARRPERRAGAGPRGLLVARSSTATTSPRRCASPASARWPRRSGAPGCRR